MAQIALTAVGHNLGGPIGGVIGNIAGSYIDSALFKQKLPDQIGPQLNSVKVQSSAYGTAIPRTYGRMRLAGNVIWARDLKKVETRDTITNSGGKGAGPTTEQTSISFSYYATLAIAICEGEIDDIIGIWADSKKLDARTIRQSVGHYEVHKGSTTQNPSTIIENYEGVGNTPAYRGLCYVVLEDFPLADYANRVPNFTFEVSKATQFSPKVEDLVKDITIIPGSGEFVYSTTITEKYGIVEDENGDPVPAGKRVKVNMHNFDNKANVSLAIEQMLATFPNLEWISVVVNWFITSKHMNTAIIIPKVEFPDTEAVIVPTAWQVGNITRANAQTVQSFPDGSPTYGGTPSDHSVIELCTALKANGLKILFYPMPLVDTVDETPGEDNKPWRGRLVPTSTSECNSWFSKTDGYNAFIRHYSQLSGLAAQIDAFVIGSELVGITTYDSGDHIYPGVSNLVSLAGLVASDFSGSTVQLTYAADWSEYHSVNGYYHLDPLWTNSHIDFVGIDNYMPLTPDLPQNQITKAKIKQYWEDGEGWVYYYSDSINRSGKTDYSPNDGTSPFAWKNIAQWWNSSHSNPGPIATGWTPKLKPLWFTEYGFASVDGAANQPNVFVDPTSVESFYPRGSKRRVDFQAQRNAIEATLEFWQDKNSESGNNNLVPRMFLWTWDARPYPFFPELTNVWADGNNWKTGHWVNSKFGSSHLGAIIADLLSLVGYNSNDYDVSALTDLVDGFVIPERQSVRDQIELLRSLYFFDMVESDGQLVFKKRGRDSIAIIAEDKLLPLHQGNIRLTATVTRRQELEMPQQITVSFINAASNYQSSSQTAQRQVSHAIDRLALTALIVMSETQARTIAEKLLYEAWTSRTLFTFSLPPEYVHIEVGDVVTITINNIAHTMRITASRLMRNGMQEIEAIAENNSIYDLYAQAGEAPVIPNAGILLSDTVLQLLDLPYLPSDNNELGTMRAAVQGNGEGWDGCVLYMSEDGGENGGNNFTSIASIATESIIGTLLTSLASGPRNSWDFGNTLDVALVQGNLSSVTELAILNGANLMLVGNELIQFQTATLLANHKYRLSKLLRGRFGTEHQMGTQSVGDKAILLDSAILKADIPTYWLNAQRHYKAVTIGSTLTDTNEQAFTYQGVKFLPYSPVQITGSRDGSQNLTINWVRRSRINGGWFNHIDVPLGEASEIYEIDIMNGNDVLRTLTANTSTVNYSAAQQVTDFGSTQQNITVNIYQLSALVGRGIAGEASI